MNAIFRVFFTAFLCSISTIIIAQSVDINSAKAIAEHHLASISRPSLKSTASKGKNFQFTSVKTTVENNDTLYYILNDTINNGFVIVSADKRAWPILGYSTERSFDEKKQPEAFIEWMENRKKEIEYIKKNNLQPDNATVASWQNLSLKSSEIETKSVEPLIQTQWDQGCYYNAMCPADAAGPCGHAVTGCTITAMAQIMKYWNFPTKGTGSHSYYDPTYGNLSADFGSTTYQWSQMPNRVTSPNDAVATLMYHCGVSLDAGYGTGATSAWDPRDELVQYFNYSSKAVLVNRSGFTTSGWINVLKSELDLQHPIYYTGSSSVGHSFICDGYQDEEYFHFNWGWGGSFDGYFYLGNLNPGWYSFNENQSALINLVPANLPDGYNGFFLSSNTLNIATKGGTTSVDVCSSANWTASSDQSWISLSLNSGVSGRTTLTLTAAENQTGSDRSAAVTISVEGFGVQTIAVLQFAVMNVTSGGLYNLVSINATTITNLTLAGTIDARDFKTMRDAMPALTDLDLSDATIVAYTGKEGTEVPDGTTNIVYPANEIPIKAFYVVPCQGQNLLKTVILPPTITSIGGGAFGNSRYLKEIKIPASVTNIFSLAFDLCSALINVDPNNLYYSSLDGVLFNKHQTILIQSPVDKSGAYTIPSTVTTIGYRAFEQCNKLISIDIPPTVTTIETAAFENCSAITNLTIPASVTSIEICAFNACSALMNVNSSNPNYSSIDGVLFDKSQKELIHCPVSKAGNYVIPSTVASINEYAFYYCNMLTNIEIPSSVATIKVYAFDHCSSLTEIRLPPSVNKLEICAFSNCFKLESVSIPPSIAFLGDLAFNRCMNLHSIFSYSISPLDLSSSSNVFGLVDKQACDLYVPSFSKTLYAEADQWKDFENIIEMPGIFLSEKTKGIGPDACTIQTTITSSANWSVTSDQPWLTFSQPSGQTGISWLTFAATKNDSTAIRKARITISAPGLDSQIFTVTQYTKVEVTPGNLKTTFEGQLLTVETLILSGEIDARDFKTMRDEMPALKDIDLSGVKIVNYSGSGGTHSSVIDYPVNGIPIGAFSDDKNNFQGKIGLNSIILPTSVTSIGDYAFENCFGLTEINIPPKTSSIGCLVFNNCTHLASINIPTSVNLIKEQAFKQFSGLISVNENNTEYSSIDGILFNKRQTELIQCPISKTGNYAIPSSVISIGNYAFDYCIGLSSVTISSSVTSIGNSAFNKCSGLTTILFSTSVSSIGPYAFGNCDRLSEVTIPSSVKTIGMCAFGSCYNLSSIHAYPISPIDLNSSVGTFFNIDKNTCVLYVPYRSKAAYRAANQWKDFKNIIELPNQAPVANAGTNQTVREGKPVTLNGAGSTDTEGNSLRYKWIAPTGIRLNDRNVAKPTFIAPSVVDSTNLTFNLVVNDGDLDSPVDQIMVTVTPNKAPTANAGNDQTVNENKLFTLNGTASSDPDNDELSYLWTAPEGIALSSNTASKPTFTAPEVTTDTSYKFSLNVSDGLLNSTAYQIVITVKNVDKAPYLKNPIMDISAYKRDPDQIIDLQTVFADDDLGDVISYSITSNTNSQVVTAKIAGSNLTVSFSSQNTGSSEIVITANSNGKEVTSKFNVEVKIPTGIDLLVFDQNFLLYPNPTTGKLKLVFDKIPVNGITVTIYDSNGKNCLKQLIRKNEEWIDLSGNVPGIYFLKTDQKNSKNQKVILK